MATRTMANFTAGLAADLDDTANVPMANNDSATRRYTVAQLRTQLLENIANDLKFTDATYDIGKSGATRPRDGFFSRNVVIGGTLGVTGVVTASAGVLSNSVSPASGTTETLGADVHLMGSTGDVNRTRVVHESLAIAAGGTVDVDIRDSITAGFSGILIVHKARTANVAFSTQTVYFVFGRGTTMTFTSLGTGSGPSGASTFTVANSGTGGIVRVTDNVTENSEVNVSYYGLDGS